MPTVAHVILKNFGRELFEACAVPADQAVQAAHHLVELVAALHERLGVPAAVHAVGDEQAAEEQQLLDEERPHPDLRGLELLRGRVEVVLEPLRAVVPVIVVAVRGVLGRGLRAHRECLPVMGR